MLPSLGRMSVRPLYRATGMRSLLAGRFLATKATPNEPGIPEDRSIIINDTLTDLEKRDIVYKRKQRLADETVRMKEYHFGLTNPGSTHYRKPIHSHLYKGQPVKELTRRHVPTAGRNNTGKITVRGREGGHKKRARILDWFRTTSGKQTVVRIEYDPMRSAHIALLKHNETGNLLYILAAAGIRAGDVVESFVSGIPKDFMTEAKASNEGEVDEALLNSRTMQRGNCLPILMIPVGSIIHAVSLANFGSAKIARSAGTFARLLNKYPEKKKAVIRTVCGEVRYVPINAIATLGSVSNKEHQLTSWGKAGRSRYRGFRPKVRGVAMNACDHPHGGGRGKSKSNKVSQSPWGLKKFAKTRKYNVNKMKIQDRPRRTTLNM